jgi:hypothetical protein
VLLMQRPQQLTLLRLQMQLRLKTLNQTKLNNLALIMNKAHFF